MNRYTTTTDILFKTFWISILSILTTKLLFMETFFISTKSLQITHVLVLILTGHIFFPGVSLEKISARYPGVIWALLLTIASLFTTALLGLSHFSLLLAIKLGIAVFSLSLLLSCGTRFLSQFNSCRQIAPAVVLMTFVLLTTLPVWLGPSIEYLIQQQSSRDLFIAMSPLTYISVMADFDYLRSQWFYANTPFGALRYSYPPGEILTLCYVLLSSVLLLTTKDSKRNNLIELNGEH